MGSYEDRHSDNNLIDQDNRARTERLAQKLSRLKNVAVDIEEETKDHIPLLDGANSALERTMNMLGSGRLRVVSLLQSNRRNRKLFCYTVLVVTLLLIIGYHMITKGEA